MIRARSLGAGHLGALAMLAVIACEPSSLHPELNEQEIKRLLEQPPKTSSTKQVVAKVGERELGLDAFERFWRSRPELDRQAALDAFIAQELLLEQALKAPLPKQDPALVYARKRGLVDAWLTTNIEQPLAVLPNPTGHQPLRDQVEQELSQPAGLSASHLLVMAPREYKDPTTQKMVQLTPEQREPLLKQALSFAKTKLAPRLEGKAASAQTLEALRDELSKEASELGLSLIVNKQMRFMRPDQARRFSSLPSGWITPVPEFVEAADTLAREQGVGVISQVVSTPFGAHFLLIEQELPAKIPSAAQVEAIAYKRALDQQRAQALNERTQALVNASSFQVFPRALDSLAERAQQ